MKNNLLVKQQCLRILRKQAHILKRNKSNLHLKLFTHAIFNQPTFTEYDRLALIDYAYNLWPMSNAFRLFLSHFMTRSLIKELN